MKRRPVVVCKAGIRISPEHALIVKQGQQSRQRIRDLPEIANLNAAAVAVAAVLGERETRCRLASMARDLDLSPGRKTARAAGDALFADDGTFDRIRRALETAEASS